MIREKRRYKLWMRSVRKAGELVNTSAGVCFELG